MQRDLQFLLDMLQSAELVITYTAQSSKDERFLQGTEATAIAEEPMSRQHNVLYSTVKVAINLF